MNMDKATVSHRTIAQLDAAHGVFDVNCVSWCPRDNLAHVFATAGDDGHLKIWKVERSQ